MNIKKNLFLINKYNKVFLVASFIFLSFFIFNNVKAEGGIYVDNYYLFDITKTGWNQYNNRLYYRDIEISETCQNPFLIFSSNVNAYMNVKISFDQVALNKTLSVSKNETFTMSLADYEAGIYRLDFETLDYDFQWDNPALSGAIILCNVDPVNPFWEDFTPVAHEAGGSIPSYTTNSVIAPEGSFYYGSARYSYCENFYCSSNVDEEIYSQLFDTARLYYDFGLVGYKIGDGVNNMSLSFSGTNWTYIDINSFILNYAPPPPPIDAWLLLWGYPSPLFSATSTFPTSVKTFPISYNLCNIKDQFELAVLKPVYSSGFNSPAKTLFSDTLEASGTPCKGLYTFLDYADKSADGSVYFDVLFYKKVGGIMTKIENLSLKSNTRNYQSSANPNDGFIMSIDSNPLLKHVGGMEVSSTTISYQYDFTHRNIASTTIILWDYSNSTTTAEFTGPFNQGTGSGSFDLPSPRYDDNRIFIYYVISEGDNTIQSSQFSVAWYYNRIITTELDLENQLYKQCKEEEPFFSFLNMCDDIDESGFSGYISGLGCSMRMALLGVSRFIFKPSCEGLVKFVGKYGDLKGAFPFSVYFDITDAMDIAIDSAITSTSTAGSIDIPFIRQTSTSSEFYMLPIASSSSFVNLIGENNYNTYKTTLAFIYWIIGALIIYFIVLKV